MSKSFNDWAYKEFEGRMFAIPDAKRGWDACQAEHLPMLKECYSALEYVGTWETPVGLIDRVWELIQKAEGNDATE